MSIIKAVIIGAGCVVVLLLVIILIILKFHSNKNLKRSKTAHDDTIENSDEQKSYLNSDVTGKFT